MLHNPNNWHWVNKDVSPWAKTYIEEQIKTIKAEDNGVTAQLDKVISMDGDVDVSQRKGKVITIFDVKLVVEYSGKVIQAVHHLLALIKQARQRMMTMSAAPLPFLKSPTTRKNMSTLYVCSFPWAYIDRWLILPIV